MKLMKHACTAVTTVDAYVLAGTALAFSLPLIKFWPPEGSAPLAFLVVAGTGFAALMIRAPQIGKLMNAVMQDMAENLPLQR